MKDLSSAFLNLALMTGVVGIIYFIWYIQSLTSKIRDLRRKEKENAINQEIQKELESISSSPLGALIDKANARFRKLRGQGPGDGKQGPV